MAKLSQAKLIAKLSQAIIFMVKINWTMFIMAKLN